jgi:hypothetical protein
MITNTLSHQDDPFLELLKQATKLSGPNEDPRIVALAANNARNYRRAVEREDLIWAKNAARYMAVYRPKPWKELTDVVCHGKKIPTCASGEA